MSEKKTVKVTLVKSPIGTKLIIALRSLASVSRRSASLAFSKTRLLSVA